MTVRDRIEHLKKIAREEQQPYSVVSAKLLETFVSDHALPEPTIAITPAGDFRAHWSNGQKKCHLTFYDNGVVHVVLHGPFPTADVPKIAAFLWQNFGNS